MKLLLARAALTVADAVVVDQSTMAYVNSVSDDNTSARLWLGEDDYDPAQCVGPLPRRSSTAIDVAATSGAAGIKVGVYVSDDVGPSLRFAHAYIEAASSADVALIMEPYFGDGDAPARRAFLTGVAEYCVYVKCDVLDVDRWGELYGQGTGRRWLARSDGLTFDSYLGAVRAATPYGCCGVMAGRAIWGDALATCSDAEAAAAVVRDRLVHLRNALLSYDGP